MKTVAIVQARMTSTRLPGKVLLDLGGAPLLDRQVERLRRSHRLDQIMVATTTNATDEPLVAACERLGLACHRGSETDVLSRYVGAAEVSGADVVVRITSDCPLIDAAIVDEVVVARAEAAVDYASNVFPRTFPRGLDTEVLTRAALEKCHAMGTSTPAREHVTWFLHSERPDLFTRVNVETKESGADLRWTVDTPEDLEVVRRIWAGLELSTRHAAYADILAWVRSHPEVARLNAMIEQKKS